MVDDGDILVLGGLTSAVYNEVLQFFLIVLGIAPLVYIGLHEAGGIDGACVIQAPAVRPLPILSHSPLFPVSRSPVFQCPQDCRVCRCI